MSLFGEKCARCGTRARKASEGPTICEGCQREMKLIVQAQAEDSRRCPIDGALMQKEISFMIVIDRCPTCRGIWLDGGELERLKGDVEEKALLAMSRSFTMPFA